MGWSAALDSKAVNTHQRRSLRTAVHVREVQVVSSAVVETINGDSMTAANRFATPAAISTQQTTIKSGRDFVVVFPEHSRAEKIEKSECSEIL